MTDARVVIERAIGKLYLKHPFYGRLLMGTEVLADESIVDPRTGMPTMGTDGNRIYFHPVMVTDILKGRTDWVMFVLAHEVEHIVRLHALRRGSKDKMRFNEAADHLINLALMQTGMKGPTTPNGEFLGLADKKYADFEHWSTERVYRDLEEDESGKGGQGQPGQGEPGDGDDAGGQGQPGDGEGDGPTNIFDGDIMEPKGKDGQPMSEAEKAEMDREVRGRVLTAAAQTKAMNGIGSIPAHLQGVLVELVAPKVPWIDELREFVMRRVPGGQDDWSGFDRRLRPLGIRMPRQTQETIGDIAVIVDLSGSCHRDIPNFMSEAYGMVEECQPPRVRTIFVDTRIMADVTTMPDEFESELRELLEHPPAGGGTDLRPAFEALEDDPDEFAAVIVFTDMATPWPDDFVYADDTIFVDVDCGQWGEAPFGRVIHYNS